jgi:L-threonylcarbamoyladenylate synthase
MAVLRGDLPADIQAAAQHLADGGLLAFPTETVYGLGARADSDTAVAAIFAVKGRPSDHPLIVHVADLAQATRFTTAFTTAFSALSAAGQPSAARRLALAFWPGPLTLIVPRAPGQATAAAGGQDSIGLRCPAHAVAQALLRAAAELGVAGVAGPSANRFGHVSPTRAAHVQQEFGPELWLLDGGDCAIGIESAIVDLSRAAPALLRPGALTRAQIEAVLGQPLQAADAGSPRAPGSLASHYAPAARLRLWSAAALDAALDRPDLLPTGLAVYSRRIASGPGRHWQRMPDDPAQAAHELFAVLRQFDDAGLAEIWVEHPEDSPAWEGVADRLRRAATP